GPPMIKAMEFAVDQINAAGGVLDQDVTVSGGDEAGDAAVASTSADQVLSEGVDAVIGAASSGMSLAIIDKITQAEVVQCSGSNTSPTFTNYDDGGYYFRTAPTDALQGPVLAETIAGDGHTKVALMGRGDDYGKGLVNATKEALEEQGAEVVAEVIYDPEAASFDAEVQQVTAANPDAIAVIAFDEGSQIIKGLIEAGVSADQLYGADGVRSNDLAGLVDPNNAAVLEGMKGTAPDPSADEAFLSDLQEFAPDLNDTTFAGQVYDCVVVIALAAIAAGSDSPSAFKDEIVGVTRDGEKCDSFESCKQLLEDGEDIDFDGASGPIEFTDAGEPETGMYEVWTINAEGQVETVSTVESTLE
ncbi:MAG TPA: ABC transporter substrate-binding protein, partial [Egibacteraceae bacterium]|nr:ABC transporter substrate-binding protein [Egibacteraceae bacterium]